MRAVVVMGTQDQHYQKRFNPEYPLDNVVIAKLTSNGQDIDIEFRDREIEFKDGTQIILKDGTTMGLLFQMNARDIQSGHIHAMSANEIVFIGHSKCNHSSAGIFSTSPTDEFSLKFMKGTVVEIPDKTKVTIQDKMCCYVLCETVGPTRLFVPF